MEAQDDEALARELHRELNVGPRRRQRRPPPPPRKRGAQGKRERPDAESTEDGSTTEDSDDFSTRVPQKTSPGFSQQRIEPVESGGGDVRPPKPHTQRPPQAPAAALERSATAPVPMQQRHEAVRAEDPSGTSGIRPKLKAAMPSTPLQKAKSVQPMSARKHPCSTPLASPPTKKHRPTAPTPTKPKKTDREPVQQLASVVAAAAPMRPLAPELTPAAPAITAGNLLKAPNTQATHRAAPSTSPKKPSAPLPLVFKGPGVVQPPQMSTTEAPSQVKADPAPGQPPVLQIAPLHLKRDLLVPGAQLAGDQPPRTQPLSASASSAQPAPERAPQTAPKILPTKREAVTSNSLVGWPSVPPVPLNHHPPTAAASVHAVAKLSPGRVSETEKSPPKPEKSPSRAERMPARVESPPTKVEKSPAKVAKSPANAEPNTSQPGDSRECDRPGAKIPPQPSSTSIPRPQQATQQMAATAENHTVAETSFEDRTRQSAYDWIRTCPQDYEPGHCLCQAAGSSFCVWLQTKDTSSRAALGAAVAAHFSMCASSSTSSEELEVTMVDMRTRRYTHFLRGSDKSSPGFVPWHDAAAKITHMLLHRAGEV